MYPPYTLQREPVSIRAPNSQGPAPADASTDGVEESDGERAHFERKRFAHGQIGRACRGRGEEENTIHAMVWPVACTRPGKACLADHLRA
jgi:hypothetical protein